MTRTSLHPAHDQLLAQIRVTRQRLDRFAGRFADNGLELDDPDPFLSQIEELTDRCNALGDDISSWSEVEVGAPTAVDDLGAAVDALEADFEAAMAAESEGYLTALDRQVRVWRGRIDRLRLQAMLGTMDAVDEFEELVPRLDKARSVALVELGSAVEGGRELATDVRRDLDTTMTDVRRDVDRVIGDIRQAVNKSIEALSGSK